MLENHANSYEFAKARHNELLAIADSERRARSGNGRPGIPFILIPLTVVVSLVLPIILALT